jgi:hypothetical protein
MIPSDKESRRNLLLLGHWPDQTTLTVLHDCDEQNRFTGYRLEHRLKNSQTLNEPARRGELTFPPSLFTATHMWRRANGPLPCGGGMGTDTDR